MKPSYWIPILAAGCHRAEPFALPEAGGAASALLFIDVLGDPQAVTALAAEAGTFRAAPFSAPTEATLTLVTYDETLAELLIEPGPQALVPAGSGREVPLGRSAFTRSLEDGSDWAPREIPDWIEGVRLPEATGRCDGGCFLVPEGSTDPKCKIPCPLSCDAINASDRLPDGPIPLLTDCVLDGPVRGDECWSDPVPFDMLNNRTFGDASDHPGSTTVEGGRTFLYFSSNRTRPADGSSFTRPYRVQLLGPGVLDPTTIEDLMLIPPVTEDPRGWVSPPFARDDGRELFVHSSYPDEAFWDEEIFASVANGGAFGPLIPIDAIASFDNGMNPRDTSDNDEVRFPLLLPDYRTLLHYKPSEIAQSQRYARRRTTAAGDTAFEPLTISPFEPNRVDTTAYALSCDRRHIFYRRREMNMPAELRIVSIRSFEPLTFGTARTVKAKDGSPLMFGGVDVSMVESPDCETLYLGDDFRTFYSRRVPCE